MECIFNFVLWNFKLLHKTYANCKDWFFISIFSLIHHLIKPLYKNPNLFTSMYFIAPINIKLKWLLLLIQLYIISNAYSILRAMVSYFETRKLIVSRIPKVVMVHSFSISNKIVKYVSLQTITNLSLVKEYKPVMQKQINWRRVKASKMIKNKNIMLKLKDILNASQSSYQC